MLYLVLWRTYLRQFRCFQGPATQLSAHSVLADERLVSTGSLSSVAYEGSLTACPKLLGASVEIYCFYRLRLESFSDDLPFISCQLDRMLLSLKLLVIAQVPTTCVAFPVALHALLVMEGRLWTGTENSWSVYSCLWRGGEGLFFAMVFQPILHIARNLGKSKCGVEAGQSSGGLLGVGSL